MEIIKDENFRNVRLYVAGKTFKGNLSSKISDAVHDISKNIVLRFMVDCLNYDPPLREIYNLKAHPEDVAPFLERARKNGYTVYLSADQHFFPRGASVYPPTEEGVRQLAEDIRSGDVSLEALVFELADENNILRLCLHINMDLMTCRYQFSHERPKTKERYSVFTNDEKAMVEDIYLHELEWLADQYI